MGIFFIQAAHRNILSCATVRTTVFPPETSGVRAIVGDEVAKQP
jgi:hypothetical protein